MLGIVCDLQLPAGGLDERNHDMYMYSPYLGTAFSENAMIQDSESRTQDSGLRIQNAILQLPFCHGENTVTVVDVERHELVPRIPGYI